jgi:hypothetical protein
MVLHTITVRIASMAVVCLVSLPLPGQQVDAQSWGKNTPGVALVAHEGPRQKTSSGTVLMYNLLGKGFPEGVVYALWQWPPGKPPKRIMEGVSFDKRGVLVCSGKPGYCSGSGPDDPVNIRTTAAPGEEKRMAVVSSDGKVAGFADAVPFPIEAFDKNCKLIVTRMSRLAETVSVRASGLKPGQPLTISTRYGEESATRNSTSNPDGTWTQVVTAPTAKAPTGKALISVSDTFCNVSVTFSYGQGSDQPK